MLRCDEVVAGARGEVARRFEQDREARRTRRRILAVGGLTTTARARVALESGAAAALVATAALADPLFAVRFRQQG